jgi:uncharacterized membrane protein
MIDSRRWWHRSRWDEHPAVRSGGDLTRGERAADVVRNGMGSWAFVFLAALFLAGWMASNRNVGFDPYPFILLNLVLSCVAAMQGAILLIAAKREDQINADLATHDYETNVETDRLVHELLARMDRLQAEVTRLADASSPVPRQ